MRALSLAQASRCETAKCKTCRCRCGGRMHGAMRNFIEEGRQSKPEQEFFETLGEDDPHHVRSAAEKKQRRKLRRKSKAPGPSTLQLILGAEMEEP